MRWRGKNLPRLSRGITSSDLLPQNHATYVAQHSVPLTDASRMFYVSIYQRREKLLTQPQNGNTRNRVRD